MHVVEALWYNFKHGGSGPLDLIVRRVQVLIGGYGDLVRLQPLNTSLVRKCPCLLKQPPTSLEWSAYFFGEPVSNFTQETPEEIANQNAPMGMSE